MFLIYVPLYILLWNNEQEYNWRFKLIWNKKDRLRCDKTPSPLMPVKWACSAHWEAPEFLYQNSFWGVRRTCLITQLLGTYCYYSGIKHFFSHRLIAMFLLLYFVILIDVKGKTAAFSLTWVRFQKNLIFLSSFIILVMDSLQCLITDLQSALSLPLTAQSPIIAISRCNAFFMKICLIC